MANQITGRIIEIGQTVQIPSKNGGSSFTKREFILDATTYDPYTGERSEYENVIPLEFSGDKCAELDRFNHGDVVTVSFMIQGRSWTNQDGELKRMASIRCYKIDARGGVSQSQQTTSVQQPAPQSTYQQQPQNFPPPVDVNGNVKDDLPFQRMLFDLKNDMEEIWKDIAGYEGLYQVSTIGRIKVTRNGHERISVGVLDKYTGYRRFSLHKDGKVKRAYVHRLVAESFIPNKLGELVYSRPIMPQEMQKTVFSINRKTGTES